MVKQTPKTTLQTEGAAGLFTDIDLASWDAKNVFDVKKKHGEEINPDERYALLTYTLTVRKTDDIPLHYEATNIALEINLSRLPKNVAVGKKDEAAWAKQEQLNGKDQWLPILCAPSTLQRPDQTIDGKPTTVPNEGKCEVEIKTGIWAAIAIADRTGAPFSSSDKKMIEASKVTATEVEIEARVTFDLRRIKGELSGTTDAEIVKIEIKD